MAALRIGAEPTLAPLGPQDPAQRAAFLGTLLLESVTMRIAVAVDTGTIDHDWREAATILLQEAEDIARAQQIDDPFAGLPTT